MSCSVDPAITEALNLDASTAKMVAHGASGFASSFKLTGTRHGNPVSYFVKTGSGVDAKVMFCGEHASLNAIHSVVATLCPQSHAYGPLHTSDSYFLATDFLDFFEPGSSAGGGSGVSLACKLARLHTTPAPAAEGFDTPMFGFPVTTCCGDTPQDNAWCASWADFYAEKRLRSVLRVGERKQGADAELATAVETTAAKVVPRLVGAVEHIRPVVVHGDLWSGNHGRARIAGRGGAEEVVYDAAAVYGHGEYDLGIMNMFGGFGKAFWDEYGALVPRAEPAEEWEDRVKLYELYHHLNHYAIFGSAYKHGALSIMKKLMAKYG